MRRTWIPLAATLLLALTACGGGPAAEAGSGTHGADAGHVPASDAAAPSPGSSSAGTSSVDVCRLLPASDVSRITGVHYTRAKSSSVMGQIFECEYTDAAYHLLQVKLAIMNGSIAYQADVQALTGAGFPPHSVGGDGDQAYAMPDPQGNAGATGAASFDSYGVLFGDQYVSIGGSYVPPDQGKQIADQIHHGA